MKQTITRLSSAALLLALADSCSRTEQAAPIAGPTVAVVN